MRLGILGTIQLAATLIFAVPVGVYGLNTLLDGQQILGGGLLAVAVLMVVLPHYLTTPTDIPAKVGESVVGKVVKTPDDEE
ncbi:hypothetical protein SAMN04487947_0613 [Halogeometricum rufum]|jgi:hypothetical protein|uniref:Uncharacterized protein n=1 Tax=Halogeometricum rufum TaxID=553469 RepID=A0A1I6G5M7_9EURY|nr:MULTISPECIES: hypothetical protein [Halogeometricum]MUV58428.1 hypothetical protein [Halogeometricum sp. CBA1124]SFR37509.1 hypothetical protein SAMN04487947_0613 [Halogeometricum rufum]